MSSAVPPIGPIRAFISYSHDSAQHTERVRELSDRLRIEGIECHIDQYEFSPPEGWPRWMQNQIQTATLVPVVCTEVYARRAMGREAAGVGLGATWEGAIITQSLYDSGGRNEKFIPVVFSPDDVAHIPPFLAGATRYDLSQPDGYERLYRHLSRQPRIAPPPVGPIRTLPALNSGVAVETAAPSQNQEPLPEVSFVMSFSGHGMFVIEIASVEVGQKVRITLRPGTSRESAFLSSVAGDRSEKLGVAFALNAFIGVPESAIQKFVAGQETWELVIAPESSDYGAGFMEPSLGNYSADDIAEMRARRILLNESLPKQSRSTMMVLQDETLEVFVRGISAPLPAIASPLPDIYKDFGRDPRFFLAVARLVLTLWLKLSGTVEHIHRLDLNLRDRDTLVVRFEGQRARKFANVQPARIAVEGTCALRGGAG